MNNKIVLVVDYVTPSLNRTKRQHWATQYREKQMAFRRLLCALSDAASPRSTPTTSPEVSKICSTAYGTLASYLAMTQLKSSSKLPKFALKLFPKKKRSSKSNTHEPLKTNCQQNDCDSVPA